MTVAKKVAIVTGAGSGVGRYASLALLEDGYHVVLAGRRQAALEETRALAGPHEQQALSVATDVTQETSVQELFAKTVVTFGRLDVLFNNAGANIPGSAIEDLALDDWDFMLATNLTGVFLCTREAIRTMKQQRPQGGRIINNGSISAHVPRPGSIAYTTTKHGVSGITKSTSLDGRPYNIACGQIDIGNAETNMTAKMKEGVPQADGSLAVEPTMDPRDVARAVVYMAGLPLDANVQSMTVMATKMPFVGRG